MGRRTLLRVDSSREIDLGAYAAREGPSRYFKNPLGALGQYYFGPLRDLRVLDYKEDHGATGARAIGFDRDRGGTLAEAFDAGVPGERFFAVMGAQRVRQRDLDELAPFCPCGLLVNPPEREQLLDLFLARHARFQEEGGTERRRTLGLLLEVLAQGAESESLLPEGMLRVAAYTGMVPGAGPWRGAVALNDVLHGWGIYQRNEILSVALQGLFAAVTRCVQIEHGGRLRTTAEFGTVAQSLLARTGQDLSMPLRTRVDEITRHLPTLSVWEDGAHELQLAWTLLEEAADLDEHLAVVTARSVTLLLALLARGLAPNPYGSLDAAHSLDPADVHLLSLRAHAKQTWKDMTLGEWVAWLATHWGVNRHLAVALRKLRAERRDTFQVRPIEGEFQVVGVPRPSFTTPRLDRGLRMLRDLGLVEPGERGPRLTPAGRQELEAIRVR